MKTLLILRHAKSSWKEELPDHERPLKKRGERDAVKIGDLLRQRDLVPDLILCSTAKRTRSTADLVAETCGYEGHIKLQSCLYGAEPEDYVQALASLESPYRRVMVIGHNPGLEMLLETLTAASELLPTAALAQIELPISSWAELEETTEGQLIHVWVPREL
ncbi:MAG: histidine phosphatase family protein [Anaerolineae bacterium]|nr:histidine phosphatase family protein [Anaerolineae bacterium]